MFIKDMSIKECQEILAIGFGRLGCAQDNQPYVVPIYFAYELEHLYGFTTLGRKIEWMRLNPRVCTSSSEASQCRTRSSRASTESSGTNA